MENTHEFVEKMHDKQRKDEKIRKRGKGHPEQKLPTKSHHQGKME